MALIGAWLIHRAATRCKGELFIADAYRRVAASPGHDLELGSFFETIGSRCRWDPDILVEIAGDFGCRTVAGPTAHPPTIIDGYHLSKTKGL